MKAERREEEKKEDLGAYNRKRADEGKNTRAQLIERAQEIDENFTGGYKAAEKLVRAHRHENAAAEQTQAPISEMAALSTSDERQGFLATYDPFAPTYGQQAPPPAGGHGVSSFPSTQFGASSPQTGGYGSSFQDTSFGYQGANPQGSGNPYPNYYGEHSQFNTGGYEADSRFDTTLTGRPQPTTGYSQPFPGTNYPGQFLNQPQTAQTYDVSDYPQREFEDPDTYEAKVQRFTEAEKRQRKEDKEEEKRRRREDKAEYEAKVQRFTEAEKAQAEPEPAPSRRRRRATPITPEMEAPAPSRRRRRAAPVDPDTEAMLRADEARLDQQYEVEERQQEEHENKRRPRRR